MHEPEELVALITENAKKRGSMLDSRQRNALERFRRIPDHNHPKEEFIEEWFLVFDDLFFFGSLRNNCRIEYPEETAEKMGGIAGSAETIAEQLFRHLCEIVIKFYALKPMNLRLKNLPEKLQTRFADINWWDYASAVLHDTIHAYLMRYATWCTPFLHRHANRPYASPIS